MCLSLTAIRTLHLAKDTDCYIGFLSLPTRISYHPSRILWSARRRQAGYVCLGPATAYHRGITGPSRSRHEKPYNRRKKRPAVLYNENHDELDIRPRNRNINEATPRRSLKTFGAYRILSACGVAAGGAVVLRYRRGSISNG
jgi:hypothetical protein